MKKLLFFILFFSIYISYSQVNKRITVQGTISNTAKEKLEGVNVSIRNTKKGTTTNKKGFYQIPSKVDDIIEFSYLGYKTQFILVTKDTETINITLKSEEEFLEEVVVKANKKKKKKFNGIYQMGRATVDITSSSYLTAKDLNLNIYSLQQSLIGKVPGLKVRKNNVFLRGNSPVLWDVDGIVYKNPPSLNPNEIISIIVLKSLNQTVSYGAAGVNGVIVVNTKTGSDNYQKVVKNVNSSINPYTNKDYYENNAIDYSHIKTGKPDYILAFNTIKDNKEAVSKLKELIPAEKNNPNFSTEIIYHFLHNYSKETVLEGINLLEENSLNKKFLSFVYDYLNEEDKLILLSKNSIKSYPKEHQSYRNLAYAYLSKGDYTNAWKIYKYYLNKGFKMEDDDIGNVMNSEIVYTYLKKKEDENFKEKLYLDKTKVTKEADVRLVIEWNAPEAEFTLEFVNPNNQISEIQNSSDEILEQKRKGYNIKEFIIDGSKSDKEWLVNINYLGNKENKPTFFKVNVYNNWGRKNQSKKVRLFKLNLDNTKYQLLKV